MRHPIHVICDKKNKEGSKSLSKYLKSLDRFEVSIAIPYCEKKNYINKIILIK